MRFSKQLREEANHIFEACYNHPFVQGIAEGQLGKEQLVHRTIDTTMRRFEYSSPVYGNEE